jgi:hypothetical protein
MNYDDKVVVFLSELETYSLRLLASGRNLTQIERKAAYHALRKMRRAELNQHILTDGEVVTFKSIIVKMFKSRGH